ncbi:ABC transporter permease/substrate-binding protein [Clostridium estertheticum]|uniref:ABC transporter permease/substrate-binding protein n=1 Tax=Clostridium estertheticum TaxID=238834 RepID=A0A5N7IZG0_9CLOT|nr:ABC transporter permease/substrate-binding protein [Clostridium estertheticum]MPQ31186.1 ABC transporter permease/substrate-binding protein [Clostridium estertheticum]MPQ61861.1 ABC transporter permease/substrate-binding protein [Clostridium estertheticum]
MNTLISTLMQRRQQLGTALLEHMQISFIAIFIAVIIAVPLGIYITRHKHLAGPLLQIASIFQTIPSLAILGILIPLVGIGQVPAVIALVIYAILPILRNTYTGIKEIDPILIEAAEGMGMNRRKQLFKVQLPLAMPVIMAGVRTSMVLVIGTATLAALIGAGGLGELILLGIDRNDNNLILVGAIAAALLAIIFDVLLSFLEKVSLKKSMIAIALGSIIIASIVITPYFFAQKKEITIAGKLGSEPEILINMYKLMIEDETNLTVKLKPGMGKTSFLFNALKSGDIDIYPEFTGTALETFVKEKAKSHIPNQVYAQARIGMDEKFSMELLEPMKYNNTYAIAVPASFAKEHNLNNISDLKNVQDKIKAGFTLEFTDREDGYKGIKKTYGVNFDNIKTMEPKLRYTAIKAGDINLVDAYSTDSELSQYNMKVLKDDKQFFPPYQGAPLMLKKTLQIYPELSKPLNKLAGKITENEMSNMNYKVNVKGESALEVAKEYLKKEGLLK